MITIYQESIQKKKLPIDFDHLAEQYKTENGLFIFPCPSMELIDRNIFYLLKNSVKKQFESKYIMRPSYLSFDEYKTSVLAPLLMYINGVHSIEDFNLNEVVIPKFSYIVRMSSESFPDKATKDLQEIDW